MAQKNIGVLTAIINADASALLSEFRKVEVVVNKAGGSGSGTLIGLVSRFAPLAKAAAAATAAWQLSLKSAFSDAYKLPGISPEAMTSLEEYKRNWYELSKAVKTAGGSIGSSIATNVLNFGRAIAVGAADLFGADSSKLMPRDESPNDKLKRENKNWFEEFRAGEAAIAVAKKASVVAEEQSVEAIKELRKQADAYFRDSQSNSKNMLQQQQSQLAGIALLTEANVKLRRLEKELATEEATGRLQMTDLIRASTIQEETAKLSTLQSQANAVRLRISALKTANAESGPTNPENIKAQIDAQKELQFLTARIIPLLEKQKQLFLEFGGTIANSFEDAVFSGNKLSDVLRNLGTDLLRLTFRNSITSPLTSALGGFFQNLFVPGGSVGIGTPSSLPGKAVGGPVFSGQSYMVGERGPEMFTPNVSGKIIPNGAGGNVYQIDARGTDESVVQRLQQALFALAGPGVVERRALSAQVSSLRRGGGMGRALQGA